MSFIFIDGFVQFFRDLINKNIATEDSGLNIQYIIVSLIFGTIFIFFFVKLWQKKVNYKHYDPEEYPQKLRNLNGFLLILIPLLIFDLIKNAYQFYSYGFLFTNSTHLFLTEINPAFLRNWWQIIIYFTIITCVFKVIFSLANLFFFSFRRRVFKFLMLTYISACVLFDGLKYFLVTQIVEPNHFIIYTVFSQWSESIYLSIVLFLYLIFSRRVNAAFSK